MGEFTSGQLKYKLTHAADEWHLDLHSYLRAITNQLMVQLQVSKVGESVNVTCSNLAGEELATVALEDDEVEGLVLWEKIAAAVHLPFGPADMVVVLPGGQRLQYEETGRSLRD